MTADEAMVAAYRWTREPGDSVCDGAWSAIQKMFDRGLISARVKRECETRIAATAEDA